MKTTKLSVCKYDVLCQEIFLLNKRRTLKFFFVAFYEQ